MMKKMLVVLLSISLIFSLGACATQLESAVDAEKTPYTADTYTASAKGMNGDVEVEVVISDTEIVSVAVLSHSETAGTSDPAIERIPSSIVEFQSLGVDAVSGATLTSNAILQAVEDCIKQAGGDIDALKSAPVKISESSEKITDEADVVVIGGGGAGISAAYEAIKAGASVLVIEKTAAIGGNTLAAGSSMNAPDSERQMAEEMLETEKDAIEELLAIEPQNDIMKRWQDEIAADWDTYKTDGSTYLYDSTSLHKLQTYVGGDYVGDPELIDAFGDKAPSNIDFIADLGGKWEDNVYVGMGATWKRTHSPTKDWGSSGSAFVLPQAKAYEDLGGKILLEHTAEELIMNDGRVIGVKGTTANGAEFEITANNAVIIATGGFAANPDMREKYNKYWANVGSDVESTNVSTAMGDGIIMAEAAGAELVGMEWIQMVTASTVGFTAAIDDCIFINNEGNRFIKEDARRDELSGAALEQPGAYFYKMYDQQIVEKLDGMTSSGAKIEDVIDGKFCFMGETLEDLAAQLEMDVAVLQETVDTYNNSVETGQDELERQIFGVKLEQGPFYALFGTVKAHHTMGGIKIDTETHVLDSSGNIIEGLYAAGEVTGGIHGSNRLGGNAITDVIAFGRTAGQNAALEK